MTWLHNHPELEVAPFLNITAATSKAGKTTLLEVVENFVRRPKALVGASEAFLFRVIDKFAPTLMLDEIDRQLKKDDNEGAFLVGLLNGSQTRATGAIGRVEQVKTANVTEHVPVEFNTFCPKVLAGIGGLADTTVERSIQIKMERKPAKEERPPLAYSRP